MDHGLGMKLFLLAASISCFIQFQALGHLVVLNQSDCVCPGHELRLECTVVGIGTTVWKGSALSGCSNNEIVLRHSRFEHGPAVGECNNGVIVGRSIRKVGDNYTSQLTVHLNVNSTLRGKTVECIYDNGTYTMPIGNHTIIYPLPLDPYPPVNLHLAAVDRNIFTFSWSPALPNCLSIGYRITMDCGVCSSYTQNTTVNCTITKKYIIGQMCMFSIQTDICGNYIGNQSSFLTVKPKVPGVPEIKSILPYYSNNLKNLTRVHVQVTTRNTDLFNTSEDSNFITTSHTATLCYDTAHTTDGTDRCIRNTILTSSCSERVCQFEFNDLSQPPTLSHDNSSAVVAVRTYSSNIIGNGLESSPIFVDKTNTLFQVTFESTNRTFSCLFIGYHGNTTCRIVYGLRDSTNQQSPSEKYQLEVENSSNNHLVMVTLPQASLQTTSEITFQFVAFGTTENYTIAVEDTFEIATDSENTIARDLIIIISVCCITTTLSVEVIISIIVCYKLLGKRKSSRQQDTEENEYIHEFSGSQPIQSQRSSDRLVYADVNLVSTRSASTRKANPAAISDDRVEYAALNHELTFEIRNSISGSDEVNVQEPEDTADDDSLNLDNLLIKIRTQVTPCWYQFGLTLGISEQVLNSYASYPPEECVVEMLDHWLRNSKVEPTWKDVDEALSKMEPYQQAKVDVATIEPYSPKTDDVCDELDSGSFPPPPLPPPPFPPKGIKAL